jgi:hypothetical protein
MDRRQQRAWEKAHWRRERQQEAAEQARRDNISNDQQKGGS